MGARRIRWLPRAQRTQAWMHRSMEIGSKAKVISSSGAHSRKFVGRTGVAVAKLTAGREPAWVVRFSTGLPSNEEGLYTENEIEWV